MNILYCRVSSIDQQTDRQRVSESQFDLVIEDKCSGAIPFFEREGGKEIKKLLDNNIITCLSVWTIDRLGRDLRDILNTIHYFTQRSIAINFISQNLRTLDEDGKENLVSSLLVSVLGMVGQMQRQQIREAQMEGIRLAKLKGVYQGRKEGATEDVLKFLSKPKNKKALEYLKKGYKGAEVATLTGLNANTITKIKKLGLAQA